MKLLHIDSSILGDNSASRQLSGEVVKTWQAAEPGVVVTYRDLAADAISHFSATTLVAAGTAAELRNAAQQHEADLSASTLAEFLAADAVVIAAPMYNFTIPTQLKAWLDRLAVAGRSFRYTENGPEGLLGGKRVIVALASGGVYSDDNPFEHAKSYLKIFFNFIGIEPEFVNAGGVAMGLDEAIAGASKEIELLAA